MSDLDAMRKQFYDTLPHSAANALAPYEAEIERLRSALAISDTEHEVLNAQIDGLMADIERMRADFAKRLSEQLSAQREISDLLAERVKALEAAVQAVRDLHEHVSSTSGLLNGADWCDRCMWDWPCPTVRILDAALGGERDE